MKTSNKLLTRSMVAAVTAMSVLCYAIECPGPTKAVINRGSCANNCNADTITSQGGCEDTSACFYYACFNWQDAWNAHTYTINWLFGIPFGSCQGCTPTSTVPTTATNGYFSSDLCGAS